MTFFVVVFVWRLLPCRLQASSKNGSAWRNITVELQRILGMVEKPTMQEKQDQHDVTSSRRTDVVEEVREGGGRERIVGERRCVLLCVYVEALPQSDKQRSL